MREAGVEEELISLFFEDGGFCWEVDVVDVDVDVVFLLWEIESLGRVSEVKRKLGIATEPYVDTDDFDWDEWDDWDGLEFDWEEWDDWDGLEFDWEEWDDWGGL